MAFRTSTVQITCLDAGIDEANKIICLLVGKTFDIVSSHTRYESGQSTLEDMRLKSSEPIVSDSLVKILLSPKRSIAFDIREKPVVLYISERQIRIERRLFSGDKLVRTILIR